MLDDVIRSVPHRALDRARCWVSKERAGVEEVRSKRERALARHVDLDLSSWQAEDGGVMVWFRQKRLDVEEDWKKCERS